MVFPFITFHGIVIGGSDMPDNFISIPYFDGRTTSASPTGAASLGVNDADTVKILTQRTAIAEGTAVSVHERDDSTSYNNGSGKNAVAILTIEASEGGTAERHIRIWSSPNDNSTTGATLILDIDQDSILDSPSERLTVICPRIQSSHYLVLENVDESRTGTNSIRLESQGGMSYVVERA